MKKLVFSFGLLGLLCISNNTLAQKLELHQECPKVLNKKMMGSMVSALIGAPACHYSVIGTIENIKSQIANRYKFNIDNLEIVGDNKNQCQLPPVTKFSFEADCKQGKFVNITKETPNLGLNPKYAENREGNGFTAKLFINEKPSDYSVSAYSFINHFGTDLNLEIFGNLFTIPAPSSLQYSFIQTDSPEETQINKLLMSNNKKSGLFRANKK